MSPPNGQWVLASSLGASRIEDLLAVTGFAEVVESVAATGAVVGFSVKAACDPLLRGCHRPEFSLEVPLAVGDAFFNSPAGYRAQFLGSPYEGQKQNQSLLLKLEGQLLAFASSAGLSGALDIDDVRLALRACSAKAWLREDDMLFGRQLSEEVLVPEWVAKARSAIACYRSGTEPRGKELPIWGVRAPRES